MNSNFNIHVLNRYIKNLNGVTVSNCNDTQPAIAVFTHKQKKLIAQIERTSANSYEIITACPLYCVKYTKKNFYLSIQKVVNFFDDSFWDTYFNRTK